jgi:hypothetical protein
MPTLAGKESKIMGYSTGTYKTKNGTTVSGGHDFDPYRDETTVLQCAYPSCRQKAITRKEDAVIWDGVRISTEDIHRSMTPLAKLAVVANPTDYVEKYNAYPIRLAFHTRCAAEFGMHLIKDALVGDNDVGRKLREPQNAIRKQETPI